MEATTTQESVRISVHLPVELHRALKRMGVDEGRTIQSLASDFIERGVRRGDSRGADGGDETE